MRNLFGGPARAHWPASAFSRRRFTQRLSAGHGAARGRVNCPEMHHLCEGMRESAARFHVYVALSFAGLCGTAGMALMRLRRSR
jgi:hypothetical protein